MTKLTHIMITIGLMSCVLGCSKKRYSVPTRAMEPTIPSGATVVINHGAYQASDPARWDIVTFEPPSSAYPTGYSHPAPKEAWIMRVVGLPGEEIEFGGDVIVIDGKTLVVPSAMKGIDYFGLSKLGINSRTGVTKFLLEDDQYFLLGDNTTNSNDSRLWGPIARSHISGKLDSP